MIQVYIAKNNGFCKGVENAVNTARKIAGEGVYILGDLIHNDCSFSFSVCLSLLGDIP